MTAQTAEAPPGYVWRECAPIKAKFLMPEGWFFRGESSVGVNAFFLTREPIVGESFIVGIGRVRLKTTSPERYFKTGLSVNVILEVTQKFSRTPSSLARRFVEHPPEHFSPASAVFRHRDGHFYIFRRLFRSSPLVVMGRGFQPANFYIEFTGNNSTGTAYMIMFETPEGLWYEDEGIARTMVETRVLNDRV